MAEKEEKKAKKVDQRRTGTAKVNKTVLIFSMVVIFAFYGPMIIFQSSLQGLVAQAMHFITFTTDWMWEFSVVGCIIFSIWLIFSKYGDIKLGAPDEKPEFSTFEWFAMLFCGGSGAGLLYWGILEPVNYVNAPPFWLEPRTAQAAQFGEAYGIFHWGISAWAMFVIPAVVFGYMAHVRKKPYMYPSYAMRDVIGAKRADGVLGRIIDAIVIVGMVGGVGTTLATFLPMICDLGANYLGVERTLGLDLVWIVIFGCMFGYSCYRGLYSGLSKISDYNMYGIFILFIVILIVGNTGFYLRQWCDSIGVLFQNFIRMSFYTDPVSMSGWPQGWTVFYWAWWYAWAMYMGLFVARISKGRTIRAVVLNMLLTTTFGCSIYYMVLGGHAIDVMMNKGINLMDMLSTDGDVKTITYVIGLFPAAKLVIPILILVMIISQVTAVDSMAYTMAQMCCDKILPGQEPPKWTRIMMAGTLVICVIALVLVGGNQVVKLSSLMTSFPVVIIEIVMAICFIRWMKHDYRKPDDFGLTKLAFYDAYGNEIREDAALAAAREEYESKEAAVRAEQHAKWEADAAKEAEEDAEAEKLHPKNLTD